MHARSSSNSSNTTITTCTSSSSSSSVRSVFMHAKFCLCLVLFVFVRSGVWTTCQQVGSIFASYLTAELLSGAAEGPSALLSNISLWGPHTKGLSRWRQTFFVSALWVFCCSVLLLRCLRSAPQDPEAAAAAKQQQQNQKQQPKQQQQQQQQQQHNSLLVRVIGIGRFRRLCGAYFCVKLVRYALLYWLAYYLEQHGGLSAAAAGERHAEHCAYPRTTRV